jgi:uncharacterized membrane protein YcgQ (UPF0703/DUF1980 family)
VAVRGLDQATPPADTWLAVEGTWQPHPRGDAPTIPALQATTAHQIPQPTDPYER